jgi:hypothetical protein
MKTIEMFFHAIGAVLAYYREASSADSSVATASRGGESWPRMNVISDSYKALLLASPGR